MFAESGYHGAAIAEIAHRSGVTPPVVYDHFDSKLDLYRRLLERTRGELLEMWAEYLDGSAPASERIPAAIDAWARYVQSHPFAPRMYFVETTGLPEARAMHEEIQGQARLALAAILGGEAAGLATTGGDGEPDPSLEMAAEVMRAGLTGLATWWLGRPEVSREQIVAIALDVVWVGLERVSAGERWSPGA